MARVKTGITRHKKRKHLIEYNKGYRWGRKSKPKAAKEAFLHAGRYAYRDRRVKKRDFRRLWQIQINAACRLAGLSYSKFMNLLKIQNISIDRKILALLAQKHPEVFQEIIAKAQEASPKTGS